MRSAASKTSPIGTGSSADQYDRRGDFPGRVADVGRVGFAEAVLVFAARQAYRVLRDVAPGGWVVVAAEIIMQPRLVIKVLPRQTEVGGDGRAVRRGDGRGDGGLAEYIVICRPDDIAVFVGGLDRRVEVIVVEVGETVLPVAVLGFDEQDAGDELGVGARAVLGGDGRCVCIDTLAPTLFRGEWGQDIKSGLGNQPFVGIEVIGAKPLTLSSPCTRFISLSRYLVGHHKLFKFKFFSFVIDNPQKLHWSYYCGLLEQIWKNAN